MILKLLPPSGSLNWLLVAQELNDPSNWSVFLLNHGAETERFRFEQVAQELAVAPVTLTPYRLKCKMGTCTLEYGWDAEYDRIRKHAIAVAGKLEMELLLPEPGQVPIRAQAL
jgi:hypothetical protein